MKDEEIVSAVTAINCEIYDKTADDETQLEFRTNGFASIVSIERFDLWSSEEDTRVYSEDADAYEPIETCLRRELGKLIARLGKISSALGLNK